MMRKILTILLIGTMCISVAACSNKNEKSVVQTEEELLSSNDKDASLNTNSSTENVEIEVTSENSLKKMEEYLKSWIEFKEYSYDDSFSDSKSFYHGYNCIYNSFDMNVKLDDGIVVNLFNSPISELVAQGYSIQGIEEIPSDVTVIRRNVVLVKENLSLKTVIRADESDISSAIIRGLVLDANDDSMGFYYNGFTKNSSNISSVINKLDSPSSIHISCDDNGNNCIINLAYSDDEIRVDFIFDYDPLTDVTTFNHIYLDT